MNKAKSYVFENQDNRIKYLDEMGICWLSGVKASDGPVWVTTALEVAWSEMCQRWVLYTTFEDPVFGDWGNYVIDSIDRHKADMPTGCLTHEWVDTGMKKTWCKHCDADGWEGNASEIKE